MCLAIPAKIVEIKGKSAKADFGGVMREINISLVDAKVGDYVIVHAGFAIQVMDLDEARKTLELLDEISSEEDKEQQREGKNW